LLIRGSEGVADDHRVLLGFLGRLLDWAAARSRSTPIVGLRVADLQGRQYFSARALLPVIDLPLPAGTYHVTVSQGDQHRRYTVALEQGITFDLQLRGATAHPWAAPEESREPGRDDAQIS
jgi:hypothetical protein